jgi:hypothetical protein
MKILENHKEQVIIQTYFIMLDSGQNIWYKEFMDPAGERVVDFDIADEDNCSILHTLDMRLLIALRLWLMLLLSMESLLIKINFEEL